MLEKILSAYESLATYLYKRQGVFVSLAIASFFIALALAFTENKFTVVGFWGGIFTIWFAGIAIYSRLFALVEDTLVDGEYVKHSLVRNSSFLFVSFSIVFIAVWAAGLTALTLVLMAKTIG